MRRVVVTGGSGFVGRRLLAALDARDIGVLPIGRREIITWSAPDAADPAWFEDADAVVHLAAHVPPRFDDLDEAAACLEVNALGTLRLLDAAARAGVAHAIVVSTGNLYRPAAPAREDDAVFPDHQASPYLASKLVGEIWARHVSRDQPLVTTILRPSSIYGPNMRGGVVRTFVDRLRHGEPLVLQDGGRFRSDLVFVDDVVHALLSCLERRPDRTFNVGSGRAVSVATLATTLVELLGGSLASIRVEPALAGDVPGFAALDVTRARRELGLVPTPLRDGLACMLAEEAA